MDFVNHNISFLKLDANICSSKLLPSTVALNK